MYSFIAFISNAATKPWLTLHAQLSKGLTASSSRVQFHHRRASVLKGDGGPVSHGGPLPPRCSSQSRIRVPARTVSSVRRQYLPYPAGDILVRHVIRRRAALCIRETKPTKRFALLCYTALLLKR